MKRILATLLFIAFATPCFATDPAPVGGQNATNNGDSTCATSSWTSCTIGTFPGSTTVGHTVLLFGAFCTVADCATSPNTVDVTIQMAGGDSFTKCFEGTPGSDTTRYGWWYSKVVTPGTTATVTPTSGTLYYGTFQMTEFANVKGTSPCDAATGIRQTGSGTSMSVTLAAPTAECHEVALIAANVGTGTVSFTGGGSSIQHPTVPLVSIFSGYQVISAISTPTLTMTDSVNEGWNITTVAFKSDSGTCPSTVASRRSFGNPRTGTRQVR